LTSDLVSYSGGEAQRVRLARELARRATGRTVYILDEPTTGLHFADVKRLLAVLERLADQGNTVVAIEHNLDVIKTTDHVIDLGPEGGDGGGEVVVVGTPEVVARTERSHTGRFLRDVMPEGASGEASSDAVVGGLQDAPSPSATHGLTREHDDR
jgi:excinuclease ABC subunit A